MRSGHFNVQHDVHVQFTFSHFDTACPRTWTVVRPLASVATDSDLLHAGDDPLMPPRWLSLDWLVYPIPLGGWEFIYSVTRHRTLLQHQDHSSLQCHAHMALILGRLVDSLELSTCLCIMLSCWQVHIQLFRCVRGVHG